MNVLTELWFSFEDDMEHSFTCVCMCVGFLHVCVDLCVNVLKMAIILPTGQWYAPSAVINDAWYCMVLHCIA